MFFFFGWGHRTTKNYGFSFAQKCSSCDKSNHFILIKTIDWFTLFFIPIIPYDTKYYLQCPICKSVFEIEEEEVVESLIDISELLKDEDKTKKQLQKGYNELIKTMNKKIEDKENE